VEWRVTVAFNVTGWLKTDSPGDTITSVEVGALATVCKYALVMRYSWCSRYRIVTIGSPTGSPDV